MGHAMLREALSDDDPSVRVTAAEALCRYGRGEADVRLAMPVLVELVDAALHGPYTSMMALNSIDRCGDLVRPWLEEIRALPVIDPSVSERPQLGAGVLKERITAGSGDGE
jgi:HEAT repeat protein